MKTITHNGKTYEVKGCPGCGQAPRVNDNSADGEIMLHCTNERCTASLATRWASKPATAVRWWNTRRE